jgi:catechol 2,3-dioxygenase-like lactoylglutathione lyase family enzyme
MFDHVGLRVKDARASTRFYAAALAPLGLGPDPSGSGFGPPGAPGLWIYEGGEGERGVHVAFAAKDRAAVDRFHAAGLAAGGRDHGKPGVRADYGPTYYAAFLLDPDGNNVEAVCLT